MGVVPYAGNRLSNLFRYAIDFEIFINGHFNMPCGQAKPDRLGLVTRGIPQRKHQL